jgi:hypothetical protein
MDETCHQYRVKRGPLSASRLLTIDPLFIGMEGPLANTRFTKDDIEGFRYGARYYYFFVIPMGRTYTIEIKSSQGKVISLRMHTFFSIGNKKTQNLFIQIYKKIHEAYFKDMAIHYVRLLNEGLNFNLAGALLTREGVVIKKDRPVIPWIRIGLTSNYSSCSICDLSDPDHYRSFDYWFDWNASLLFSVVDYKIRSTTYELLK